MNDLIIPLNPVSKEPIYQQIYSFIKNEIKSGNLPFSSRLPSQRALSRHMQISRCTVDMAYAQLAAEGYIESIPCKGYFVAKFDGLYIEEQRKQKTYSISSAEEKKFLYDFSPRGIDVNNFPYNTWRKITKNILSQNNIHLFETGDPKGDFEFRQAICNYLHQARGVNCSPEQIIVGAGNEYLLMRLHQLLPPKSKIAMENPTYKQAYRVLAGLGHIIQPIEMDSLGMNVEALSKKEANIAYVMPSHQFPMGIVMPMKRRLELLAWAAKEKERYIIEDDYDSEFRYRGKPIPSLQGFDRKEKVIYLGTFSRSIAPAIRVSYMVLPNDLKEIYLQYHYYSSTVSRLDQTVIGTFLNDGYFERHLNRMRTIYKGKHDILLSELKKRNNFTVSGENAGTHLLLNCMDGRKEKELIQAAETANVKVYGLSEYYIHIPPEKGSATLILGYASLTEEQIREGIQRLGAVW